MSISSGQAGNLDKLAPGALLEFPARELPAPVDNERMKPEREDSRTDCRALPAEVGKLAEGIEALRQRYGHLSLTFTPDGNLVGDLGEAIAAELFGVQLSERNAKGIDGSLADGRTVQVKASGRNRGVAFTDAAGSEAELLLVLRINFRESSFEVIYRGPYAPVRALLPGSWRGQKIISMTKLRSLQAEAGEGWG